MLRGRSSQMSCSSLSTKSPRKEIKNVGRALRLLVWTGKNLQERPIKTDYLLSKHDTNPIQTVKAKLAASMEEHRCQASHHQAELHDVGKRSKSSRGSTSMPLTTKREDPNGGSRGQSLACNRDLVRQKLSRDPNYQAQWCCRE